jgi:hypothetical protein
VQKHHAVGVRQRQEIRGHGFKRFIQPAPHNLLVGAASLPFRAQGYLDLVILRDQTAVKRRLPDIAADQVVHQPRGIPVDGAGVFLKVSGGEVIDGRRAQCERRGKQRRLHNHNLC